MKRTGEIALGSGEAVSAQRAVGCAVLAALSTIALVGVGTIVRGTPSSRSVAATVRAEEHGLAAVPSSARGPVSAALGSRDLGYRVRGLRAHNFAQRLDTSFSRAGVTVGSASARVRLKLIGYGRAGAVRKLGSVLPRVTGNRVIYDRGGVREWWANGPLGLEQGVDVRARPTSGRGPLTLSLALGLPVGVDARIDRGGELLLSRSGAVVLRYSGLEAVDAHGRTLRSWLQTRRGRVLIRVDDRGAAYPVAIDPFVQAKLSAADGAANEAAGFAAAVSADGSTIAVGAPGVNGLRGAVYVFVRGQGGWANESASATLTAADSAPGDQMGWSVGVSGDGSVVVASSPVAANSRGAAYVFSRGPAAGRRRRRPS